MIPRGGGKEERALKSEDIVNRGGSWQIQSHTRKKMLENRSVWNVYYIPLLGAFKVNKINPFDAHFHFSSSKTGAIAFEQLESTSSFAQITELFIRAFGEGQTEFPTGTL